MTHLKLKTPHLNDKLKLNNLILGRLNEFLDQFGLYYRINGNRVIMACPIHNGDNTSAVNIFIEGFKIKGNWKCWTHACEEEFGCTLVDFFHGILYNANITKDIDESIQWIKDQLNKPQKVKLSEFNSQLTQNAQPIKIINKIEFRSKLIIPAKYYIQRGYKKETLNKFDVGLCLEKKNPFYMRIVIPVYDETGYNVIGQVARSQNSECPFCSKFHFSNKPCPANNLEKYWAEKWLNSKGFSKSKTLYNLWNAKENIQKIGIAILVEGQGDVWRLDEAGISNVLGMFGKDLTYEQHKLLQSFGTKTLVVLTDTDEAGNIGYNNIVKKYGRYYNIIRPHFTQHDIGDMPVCQINEVIKPQLKGLMND